MDTAVFPKRSDDFFPIAITPVVCSPIPGGFDQFVVAALCSGRGTHHLVQARIEQSVRRLYPHQAAGVLIAVEIGLADLSEASEGTGFSAGSYQTAVSSISLGEPMLTEGRDLSVAGERWLQSMSSLHRPLTDEGTPDEISKLRHRVGELEALAEHPDPGLWRFWNMKAAELASNLRRVQDELELCGRAAASKENEISEGSSPASICVDEILEQELSRDLRIQDFVNAFHDVLEGASFSDIQKICGRTDREVDEIIEIRNRTSHLHR